MLCLREGHFATPLQPCGDGGGAVAVEAETVDYRLVGVEAEQARTRIAGLRPRRDRADFGKAEAKRKDRVNGLAIFVEARGQAERIWKDEPERLDRKARIIHPGGGETWQERQGRDRQHMRRLRVEAIQDRLRNGAQSGDESRRKGRDD